MGNHPSTTPPRSRPVVRVSAQPRPQPTQTTQPTPGYKSRPAPRPPTIVPSYKNPYNLVLPKEVPNGILKSHEPSIPIEDYFSDDHDTGSELDSPDEDFQTSIHRNKRGKAAKPNRPMTNGHLEKTSMSRLGNYTPNGEIMKYKRSKSLPLNGVIEERTHRASVDLVQNYETRESPRDSDYRVSFALGEPALGEVVRPFQRTKKKAPAPPPPRMNLQAERIPLHQSAVQHTQAQISVQPTHPVAQPPPPLPPAVIPLKEITAKPRKNLKQNAKRQSLHDVLQQEIIHEAHARQSRDPIVPPKIVKPKSGHELFKDELVKACKRMETYGEDTDGMTSGATSEWDDRSVDLSDYKPKTTSKFQIKPNDFKRTVLHSDEQSVKSESSNRSQRSAVSNQTVKSQSQNVTTSKPRSQSEGNILGTDIRLIRTNSIQREAAINDWIPDDDLQDFDFEPDALDSVDTHVHRQSENSIFAPGVRMNASESSIGSARMYRSKSIDRGRQEKPSRYNKHRNTADETTRSKYSSIKDSIRTAFSSLGTSTNSRKDRKTVKGYFDQGYRHGPDVTPVMYYNPGDPYYNNQGYYPMHTGMHPGMQPGMHPGMQPGMHPGMQPMQSMQPLHPMQAMPHSQAPFSPMPPAPTMPYGPWYENPYRNYHRGSLPVQPIMYTDGHRRAFSMDELSQVQQIPTPPTKREDKRRSRSRSRKEDPKRSNHKYTDSWNSLKDDIQYDSGSLIRSWRLKGRRNSRSKSSHKEDIDDWNRGDKYNVQAETDSDSDDEQSRRSAPASQGISRPEASRRYQDALQNRNGRRRPHGKKNSSSSDENKPPTKLLKGNMGGQEPLEERSHGLPPSGKSRSRYKKRGNDADIYYQQ